MAAAGFAQPPPRNKVGKRKECELHVGNDD